MAYLLVSESHTLGGAAFYDDPTRPFAMGTHAATRGSYTFTHELAHIMGADHNREDEIGELNYPYGMGKLFNRGQSETGGYRTIMA
jgi:hypothetical protein